MESAPITGKDSHPIGHNLFTDILNKAINTTFAIKIDNQPAHRHRNTPPDINILSRHRDFA